MNKPLLNRETNDKDKGKLLQKFRVIQLLLQKIRQKTQVIVSGAVEYKNDVAVLSVGAHDYVEYIEGLKNYTSKNFSLMSEEVRNDLVICLDCWCSHQLSEAIEFGFYTTVSPVQERNSDLLKSLDLEPLDKPVLELLMNGDLSDKVVHFVRTVAIYEYKRQYKKFEDKGNLSTIEDWDTEMWRAFLNKINWQFNQDDDDKVRQSVISEIQISPYFEASIHKGKEVDILHQLVSIFEERSILQDRFRRLVQQSDIELVFSKMGRITIQFPDTGKKKDQSWRQFDREFANMTDKRDLITKLTAVSPEYNKKKFHSVLARRLMSVENDLSTVSNEESSSYQYRVFLGCDKLHQQIKAKRNINVSKEVVDTWLEQLTADAMQYIEDISQDFYIPFKSKDMAEKTVLLLFEKCFLAFDGEEDED